MDYFFIIVNRDKALEKNGGIDLSFQCTSILGWLLKLHQSL